MPDGLECAAELDAAYGRNPDLEKMPMYGVVFSFKDPFDTKDMRTTAGGDAAYDIDFPARDHVLVEQLRNKGAIIFAKAVCTEYNGPLPASRIGKRSPIRAIRWADAKALTSALMFSELLRRVDMMVMLKNRVDALVRLHTPLPPAKIGGAHDTLGGRNNLGPELFYGPNAGLTEVLIPAGYVTTVYDPVFALSPDGTRYVSVSFDIPTTLPPPGLPFSSSAPKPPQSAASRRRPLARYRAIRAKRINALNTASSR